MAGSSSDSSAGSVGCSIASVSAAEEKDAISIEINRLEIAMRKIYLICKNLYRNG